MIIIVILSVDHKLDFVADTSYKIDSANAEAEEDNQQDIIFLEVDPHYKAFINNPRLHSHRQNNHPLDNHYLAYDRMVLVNNNYIVLYFYPQIITSLSSDLQKLKTFHEQVSAYLRI